MGKIIIKFNMETGETNLETKGFSGKECMDISKFLKKALGNVSNERKTSEYYKVKTNNIQRVKKW